MWKRALKYTGVVVLAVAVAILLLWATRPPPLIVQGEVEATRVDLAPRVSGRVQKLGADVGDTLSTGTVAVELSSPQLQAALAVAEAALLVAKADRDRVYSTRAEIIALRKAEVEKAAADLVLAQQIHARQEDLLRNGNTSQQAMDEAANRLAAAGKAKEAAAANLALVEKGSSDEEKALADARVQQSEAAVAQIRTDVAELIVRAPITGVVTTRVAEIGELFSPGAPVMSIVDLDHIWVVFNLREDLLGGLAIGDIFEATIPALGEPSSVKLQVTAINAQGQYANWRATKATGDFDLRTFEVRAKPVTPVAGLRPGMSAVVHWQTRSAPRS